MAVIKSWAGDGLSAGALTTSSAGPGDTAFDSLTGTGLTVTTDGIRSPCIASPDGAGLLYARWNATPANWALRFYVKLHTASSGEFIAGAYDSASNKVTAFDFNSSGQLRLSTNPGANVNFHVATAAFPLDTWVRVEYTETAAGAWTLAYYTGDSTVAIGTGSGTKATPQALASVRFGRLTGAIASSGLRFDDLALADTASFIGSASGLPASPWYAITSGGLVPLSLTAL